VIFSDHPAPIIQPLAHITVSNGQTGRIGFLAVGGKHSIKRMVQSSMRRMQSDPLEFRSLP
jgi:hypothetical protein